MTTNWTFRDLQTEHAPWVLKNFGDRPAWQPLLGIVEEIGEYEESITDDEIRDAMADIVVFMSDFCNAMKFDLDGLYAFADDPDVVPTNVTMTTMVGKLCHSFLKKTQGIRGNPEDHDAAMRLQLVGILSLLDQTAQSRGWKLYDVVRETWEKVRLRDWTKNAQSGVPAAT